MLYQPDLIVYLWTLPVIGFVLMPLAWALAGMFYRQYERSKLADIRGYIEVNKQEGQPERRKEPRVTLEGGKASVAQNCKCCSAQVANISKAGICLKNRQHKMDMEHDRIKMVFKTKDKYYTMDVRPKWIQLVPDGYVMGGEIVNRTRGWRGFVRGKFLRPLLPEAA